MIDISNNAIFYYFILILQLKNSYVNTYQTLTNKKQIKSWFLREIKFDSKFKQKQIKLDLKDFKNPLEIKQKIQNDYEYKIQPEVITLIGSDQNFKIKITTSNVKIKDKSQLKFLANGSILNVYELLNNAYLVIKQTRDKENDSLILTEGAIAGRIFKEDPSQYSFLYGEINNRNEIQYYVIQNWYYFTLQNLFNQMNDDFLQFKKQSQTEIKVAFLLLLQNLKWIFRISYNLFNKYTTNNVLPNDLKIDNIMFNIRYDNTLLTNIKNFNFIGDKISDKNFIASFTDCNLFVFVSNQTSQLKTNTFFGNLDNFHAFQTEDVSHAYTYNKDGSFLQLTMMFIKQIILLKNKYLNYQNQTNTNMYQQNMFQKLYHKNRLDLLKKNKATYNKIAIKNTYQQSQSELESIKLLLTELEQEQNYKKQCQAILDFIKILDASLYPLVKHLK